MKQHVTFQVSKVSSESQALVKVSNLEKYFPLRGMGGAAQRTQVKAVDGVSFEIKQGQAFGLVGESGCGKSTMGRLILGLIQPSGGEVLFDGRSMADLSAGELKAVRRSMQMVFQDPYSSLNPRHRIGRILSRPLTIHHAGSKRWIKRRVSELLSLVGLAEDYLRRLPNALSGGERQRVAIARALALEPRFLVLDEPTSALDVSVQARIINLLSELQDRLQLTYLFISHNLSLVEYLCDRTMVMYAGQTVELGPTTEIHRRPLHPYTRALISSVLVPSQAASKVAPLPGDVPAPWDLPSGCRFHPRCPECQASCREEIPALMQVEAGHFVACHRVNGSA
jgi:oligopeptide/dipeptide ABC transporter ATP-binding protein